MPFMLSRAAATRIEACWRAHVYADAAHAEMLMAAPAARCARVARLRCFRRCRRHAAAIDFRYGYAFAYCFSAMKERYCHA